MAKKESKKKKEVSPKEMARVALSTFFKMAEIWGVKPKDQRTLLGLPQKSSTYDNWKKGKYPSSLDRDKLERISYLLGIWKALNIIFQDTDQADTWLKKPNTAPLFNGQSALDKMLAGSITDLRDVRQYLDAQRGWS